MAGVEEFIDKNNFGKADCGNEEEGNDDDCIVLLPGEEKINFKETVESDSDNERICLENKEKTACRCFVC